MKKKRVIVGLSGGVDSSVAAYLLKEQGYEVIGLFMKNWHDDSVTISNECPWLDDSNDAMLVADKLGIPFQTVDLSEQYKERIVDYMFHEYEKGRTPNPDVLCNREIKFDVFMKIALDLGADYVATGHYCRKHTIEKDGKQIHQLLAGADANKDQSYFLCQLSQEQLAKALFPIGELQKPEVREIAAQQGLITAEKKDSQGLCFIGKVRLPEFLQQQLKPKEGIIVEVSDDFQAYNQELPKFQSKTEELQYLSKKISYKKQDGKVVGKHQGAHYFTKGQRKGLAVGGTVEPLFVIDTNVEDNIIYTGQGKQHPGLFKKVLFVSNDELHWVREDLKLQIDETMDVMARIRYRQPLQKATLHQVDSGMYVEFQEPQSAITEGQFVAWYLNDELVGSGVIS
ncbi:MAG: tRNA 2-thiouridine(34) synthase MnmA [Xanthomarina sp.]|jgi:tRNA-specific 2-thiouridylase|uniref:tRNA-specific 2-thiouridylase MnmA n=1 Tax=Xanthomarina gelatinilytica TaxID=1137281 RepID=A0A3D6BRK7_9FLAO|nr:tRNA 2-thiouridine(34) synthase MnmA [Xanthomarina sp.]MCB0387749.1 tRNA 2-thiouridine(34) synthase MnmA [Winogradskyella sp.]MDX1316487.1 tRNA 2-thiouridine(34) synthase MnmA [Xanthomarina gelatinilytica]MAL23643.1 tRNA 2-thiouridine(34) synthase MnmA [Xanthomarina sp.]MBF60444.1 tRNA 2-thiouridine(34) synthase MnmA [Xanthomarina sp.]HAB28037.1 tRNA 2-thiouridine(34) synthase MnmA [Xanthomarina gelatinilytica]|tara:strand:+ start:178 stop:1371 length:1194 start_codon:yes stop_codon:yes gene_type:complete